MFPLFTIKEKTEKKIEKSCILRVSVPTDVAFACPGCI